jgi:hypothetical protein
MMAVEDPAQAVACANSVKWVDSPVQHSAIASKND